jgi:NTP pyrophosphatase (non-canonical NTP hydrolase)
MQPKTLSELQNYYKQKAKERGFDGETAQDTLLLMTEELGELARAVRKNIGVKIDNKEKIYAMEEELADIQNYLFHLSNILGINLEEAYWKKEAENETRKWK